MRSRHKRRSVRQTQQILRAVLPYPESRTAAATPAADNAGADLSGDGGAHGAGDAVGRTGLGVAVSGGGCHGCRAAGGGSAAGAATAVQIMARRNAGLVEICLAVQLDGFLFKAGPLFAVQPDLVVSARG